MDRKKKIEMWDETDKIMNHKEPKSLELQKLDEGAVKKTIIPSLCNMYNCSDSDDKQYPHCNMFYKYRCPLSQSMILSLVGKICDTFGKPKWVIDEDRLAEIIWDEIQVSLDKDTSLNKNAADEIERILGGEDIDKKIAHAIAAKSREIVKEE